MQAIRGKPRLGAHAERAAPRRRRATSPARARQLTPQAYGGDGEHRLNRSTRCPQDTWLGWRG